MANFQDENIKIQIVHKELDLIQKCIERMASNSFMLKGWTVSLFAVLLGLSNADTFLISISLICVVISFWYLDAFFLYTERNYRRMYISVLSMRSANLDTYLYDLNSHGYRSKGETTFTVMFRNTLLVFYGGLLIVLLCYVLYKFGFLAQLHNIIV